MSGKSSMRSQPGFTLVEILCTCAIIAALAGLVVPLIFNGVMAANRAKCASNMRQIGVAILSFAGDNHGVFPVTSHSTGDNKLRINGEMVNTLEYSWIYTLAPYLGKMDEVRVCPADEKDRQQRILSLKATSYLLNDTVFDSAQYGRLQNLPDPSRTMLMFISNRPVSRTWDHAHCAQWTNWAALNEDIAPDRHRKGNRSPDRRKGSANYLFADGRVENILAGAMKQTLDAGETPWLPEERR